MGGLWPRPHGMGAAGIFTGVGAKIKAPKVEVEAAQVQRQQGSEKGVSPFPESGGAS